MQLHSYGKTDAVCWVMTAAMLVGLLAINACSPISGSPSCAAPRRQLHKVQRWLCYYGSDRAVLALNGYDLLILDADALGRIAPEERRGRVCLAYLSIGEVNSNSRLWPQVKDRPWLASANPNWPEARRVDVRSPEWQDLIIRREAPRLLAAGYDGLFLDTLDASQNLLAEKPADYVGSREATAAIVQKLRRAFPQAVLIANGAFDLLPLLAKHVDAFLYEGVRSTYDFVTCSYRRRTPAEIAWLDEMAARIKACGLPLFALEYASPGDPAAAKALAEEIRRLGAKPFVAQIELNELPGEQP